MVIQSEWERLHKRYDFNYEACTSDDGRNSRWDNSCPTEERRHSIPLSPNRDSGLGRDKGPPMGPQISGARCGEREYRGVADGFPRPNYGKNTGVLKGIIALIN